jgi:hypothetical protein
MGTEFHQAQIPHTCGVCGEVGMIGGAGIPKRMNTLWDEQHLLAVTDNGSFHCCCCCACSCCCSVASWLIAVSGILLCLNILNVDIRPLLRVGGFSSLLIGLISQRLLTDVVTGFFLV